MDDKEPITRGDLKDDLFISFFSGLVIKVIRKCFVLYSPIIITIILSFSSLVYWGFNQLMTQHQQTADRQLKMFKRQQTQDIKINMIEADVIKLKNKK